MAVTLERTRRRGLDVIVDAVFGCSVWVLALAVFAAATLIHGYRWSTAMAGTLRLAADPFTQNPDVGAWGYQSPLGPMIAWALRLRGVEGVAAVNYAITFAVVIGGALAVERWVSDYAARLFLFAYFCSPQSWAGTAYLGTFDIITVGGLTLCAVGPPGVCLAAGVVLGFNHFEQGGIALVAIAVIRIVIRHEPARAMIAAFAGLAVGKAILMLYLIANDINTEGRVAFIRETGLRDILGGSVPWLPLVVWAVYNVLWVGMIWMLRTMPRRDRWLVIGMQLALTVPVLITYDLSRVYRTLTWPLVLLLVLYAAEWPDRRLVQRWALLLAVAACVVPRTEIWHGGLVLN